MPRAFGLFFSVLLVACCLACGGLDAGPTSVKTGDPVQWLDTPGTLSDTYGKLAQVDLGGVKMWVSVEDVDPVLPVLAVPASDTCAVKKGATIPMGSKRSVITEVYGSMARPP